MLKFYIAGCSGWAAEIPSLKEALNRFKDNNLNIIGICIDADKNAWFKDLQENSINWISTFQPFGGKATIIYNVNSNSHNVLIDPLGKIVAKDIDIQGNKLMNVLENEFIK